VALITTYATLQAGVLSELHRSDLAAVLPRLIQTAEAEMFRDLPLRDLETTATGTTSGATIALPAGMAVIERLEIVSGGVSFTLDYTSPNGIEALTYGTGLPSRYTVEGAAIRLIAAPDGSYTYTLHYIPNLDALSDSNTDNWLLLNAPDVYLHAVVIQAALWTKNDAEVAKRTAFYQRAVESVRRASERKRLPVSGGLQIKPRNAR
jgi:hypothetical protein